MAETMTPGLRHEEIPSALLLGTILTLVYVVVLAIFGGDRFAVMSLPAVAAILLMLWNMEIAGVVLVSSLFVDFSVSWFTVSIWIALPVGIGVLWYVRNLPSVQIPRPLLLSIAIYGVSITPSLVLSAVPFISAYKLLNVLGFLVALLIPLVVMRGRSGMKVLLVTFLILSVLNSLDIIVQSQVLQRRSYGFAGITSVDYTALSLCVVTTLALTARGIGRFAYGSLAVVIAMALILTQTRNTWISAALTLIFLAAYVIVFPRRAFLTRSRALVLGCIGAAVLGMSVLVALDINPGVGKRASELATEESGRMAVDREGAVTNSLVSRILIWSTAYNAFIAHPVTGVGVYAFPTVSGEYSTIPRFLFLRYVEGLSPHQTHLAVLAETGIVGFIGFSIFILTVLRLAFRVSAQARTTEHRRAALVVLVALVYSVISMTFTDAWLWGSLIVLFGLTIGVLASLSHDTGVQFQDRPLGGLW